MLLKPWNLLGGRRPGLAQCIVLLALASPSAAQTLSLFSATMTAAGTSLNLVWNSGGNAVAALQWTLQYAPGTVSSPSVMPGPALTTAGKSVTCVDVSGSYTCIAYGLDAATIPDGSIATISLIAQGTASVLVANPLGASPDGSAVSVTGNSGVVTISAAPMVSSLACVPTTIPAAASSNCTVMLNGPPAGTTVVEIDANSTAVIVPAAVLVLPGSTTARFAAVSSGALNSTVLVTARLNGTSASATLALTTSAFSVRVQAGGTGYVDSQGNPWSADAGFNGGAAITTDETIINTSDPALYQSSRSGPFAYSFVVPNGNYSVNLKFAETTMSTVGQRIFSVMLNGTTVLPDFDVIVAAGGPFLPVDETFSVTVTNGTITLGFVTGKVSLPMVSAIEIVPQGVPISQTATPAPLSFSPIYINCGGPAFNDELGVQWAGDELFSGGSVATTNQPIINTATPVIYQTGRSGQSYYAISLPNGDYLVRLKFAEIMDLGVASRKFNVGINGVTVLQDFDIAATAGGPLAAADQTFSVTVKNGALVLTFTPGSTNVPLVNGIEVVAIT